MASITNKTSYPQDSNVSGADYLIGTDSASSEVKTFTLNSISTFVNASSSGGVETGVIDNLTGNLSLSGGWTVSDSVSEYVKVGPKVFVRFRAKILKSGSSASSTFLFEEAGLPFTISNHQITEERSGSFPTHSSTDFVFPGGTYPPITLSTSDVYLYHSGDQVRRFPIPNPSGSNGNYAQIYWEMNYLTDE